MKKSFNSVQTLKSSGNCDKYSKSVSYETLVGGTTTTGKEYNDVVGIEGVITRRTLVRRGYLPEQGTHANEESLFASVTCFMRLPRRIQRMLLVMTIPTLALIFTLATTTESLASCRYLEAGGITSCKTLEESGTCGTECNYTYDSETKTVYITTTGDEVNIADSAFRAIAYENNILPVESFIINGSTIINYSSFRGNNATISGRENVLVLNKIGRLGLHSTTLSGTIIIPEEAKFGSLAFSGVTLAKDAKIYCGVENCKQKMIDSCNEYPTEAEQVYVTPCLNAVNNIASSGKLLAYPDGCAKMGASGCTKCKNANFKPNDGECDRLRYTPAEAAKVLTDDNNNSVTITFKK